MFINCWSEDGGPPSEFEGQVTIISGKIGGNPQYMTSDSSAFILEHGVATRAPLVYKNLNSKGREKAAKSIASSLGAIGQTSQGPGTDMIAFQWATLISADDQNIDDSTSLRYLDQPYVLPGSRGHGWWALEHNNSLHRHMIRFPTTRAFARLPAPWFVNGIYLGRDANGLPRSASPRRRHCQSRKTIKIRSRTRRVTSSGTAIRRQVDPLAGSASIAGRTACPWAFRRLSG